MLVTFDSQSVTLLFGDRRLLANCRQRRRRLITISDGRVTLDQHAIPLDLGISPPAPVATGNPDSLLPSLMRLLSRPKARRVENTFHEADRTVDRFVPPVRSDHPTLKVEVLGDVLVIPRLDRPKEVGTLEPRIGREALFDPVPRQPARLGDRQHQDVHVRRPLVPVHVRADDERVWSARAHPVKILLSPIVNPFRRPRIGRLVRRRPGEQNIDHLDLAGASTTAYRLGRRQGDTRLTGPVAKYRDRRRQSDVRPLARLNGARVAPVVRHERRVKLVLNIGSILAPRGVDLITGTASFSEYYGTSVGYPCGRLPPSTVYFYQPILNNGRSRATIGSSNKLQCSAGRVTPLPLWNNTLSQLELGVTLVVVDDPTMRSVLVEIYHATGGPTWTTRTNWLSDQPIGTWHGVRTDAAGRVTHLQLPNNGLTGRIPDALRRLPRLEDLRLAGNDLVGPIPAWLETLPLLRELWLNSNRLSGRIPAELGALTRLGHLSLDRNAGLRGPVPAEFGNLTTLWTLRLNHTGLTGPLPLALANLRSLNYMDVRNTGLCAPDDPAFQSWLRTVNAVNGGIATCTRRATP